MCINTSESTPSRPMYSTVRKWRSKRSKIRVCRLSRRKRRGSKETAMVRREMELKNMKLFLENRSIVNENEKLRKKALQLLQENQTLMSEFQKQFSHRHDFATPLLHPSKPLISKEVS
ncbi:hypothetical protein HHK36_027897 [Tetracentron sinense]|uniref:Uncharacterized protein n=1 Tax=Tetracentron sinense TaxID=13715 RepID=A0A835D3Z1_TETSI|nr:hypothetical protein HHK36_027897 [Tetracentron sinense]